MPAFLAGLIAAGITALGNLLWWLFKRLLISFGVGLVAYTAVEPFINWALSTILSQLSFTDEFGVMAWLGVMRFGECFSVIFSAAGFAMVMRYKNRAQMRIDADKAARNWVT